MLGINGVGLNSAIPYTNSLKKNNVSYATSFQGNSENTEEPQKKKSHKLLKALVLAGIAIGGYFLFKKHGSAIKDKLKNLFDSLKNKTKEAVETVSTEVKPAVQETKEAVKSAEQIVAERTIQPKTDLRTFIDKREKIGVPSDIQRAKDSVAAFEAHGLTETEKRLNRADEIMAEIEQVSQRARFNVNEIGQGVGMTRVPKSAEESVAAFEAHGLTDFEKQLEAIETTPVVKEQPVKPRKNRKKRVPSKRVVIRDNTTLKPGQKTEGKGRPYSKIARHNKQEIIRRTYDKEQV